MIFLQFVLSTFKLVMAIVNISFFVGMGWYTFINVTQFIMPEDNFFSNYGILENTEGYRVVQTMYFSFTTLSTVGFGDYHPVNYYERAVACFILLYGVAIFSYIQGNFIEII